MKRIGLKKVFKEYKKEDETEVKEQMGFINDANVCMFIPKKENLKNIFKIAEGFEEYKKVPEVNNTDYQTCGFSTEYLELLLFVLKKCGNERVKLTIAKDYPMVAETKDFKFILAPNVGED